MPLALYHPQENENKPTQKSEEHLGKVSFTVHKFNNRSKPLSKDRILIVSCFSEFGCETVGITYCIPKLLKRFPGMYVIAMGWYGRQYFYKHLVDEFWEMGEEFQHLRNRTFAFHHNSANLKTIEEKATDFGSVVPSASLGKFAVGNVCKTCGAFWNEWRHFTDACPKCTSTNVVNSLFGDAESYIKTATPLPRPSKEKLDWASSLLEKPSVGVFARGRKTYGRNLSQNFYIKLIKDLRERGYNPIWLGEKATTQPCPVDDVFDFSRCEESRDLEKTLAIICNCSFTIQYWTASSRLAGLMGVPFLLFESPEQIYCSGHMPGQEGRRLELTTFGKKKLAFAHYLSSVKEEEKLLFYTKQAIEEIEQGNYNELITELVSDVECTKKLQEDYYKMIKEGFHEFG